MTANLNNIGYKLAAEEEAKVRYDVMAHVQEFDVLKLHQSFILVLQVVS